MTSPSATRLPIPNAAQLTVRMLDNGQDAVVVLGAVVNGGVLTSAKANVWLDAAWQAFKPLMAPSVTCSGGTCRDVSSVEGQVFDLPAPPTPTGTGATVTTVRAATTLVKWSSATGGRTGKGRTYFPGIPAGSIDSGGRTYIPVWSTSVQTAVNAYLNSAALATEGIDPAILSFTRGAARPITSGALAPVVGIQRRRMRG